MLYAETKETTIRRGKPQFKVAGRLERNIIQDRKIWEGHNGGGEDS